MTGKRLIFLFLSALIFVSNGFTQTNSINGRIEDGNGKPIPGAAVILRNTETGLERVVKADGKGEFTFAGVTTGNFKVIASAFGFGRTEKPLDAASNITITLEPASINEQVTVVSGSRQEELRESLTTKVDVLTANDIKTTGYESVGEALREVPGVMTRRNSEGTTPAGHQVQGIDSRQVLVLMDGQPLVGARGIKSGILNLDRQSTGRLESIEVVKGASSALYGSDAIGGVVNLRTKDPDKPFNALANVSGGNYGVFDARGLVGFQREKLSGIFSAERHKHNGFDLDPSTFTAEGSGFHRYDAYGKLKYQFSDGFSLTGFANSYWNNTVGRFAGEPTLDNPTGLQTSDIDDTSQNYGLTADWALDGKTNLQFRGYFARFDEINLSNAYPTGAPLADGNLFERYGKFDVTFSRIIGESHFLQAGFEVTTNRYSGLNRLQNDKGRADTQVFWVQDKINLLNRLTLTVGARFDHNSIFGSAASPKIGLNFRVTNSASLRASWGRGFRAPDLGQIFYRFSNPIFGYQVLGNPSLRPEHSGSWQVGGEFNALRRKARLGVNFFRNDVRNLINSTNLGMVTPGNVDALLAANGLDPVLKNFVFYNRLLFVYQNLANVFTQGVEFDGSYILPAGFSVHGAYTYLDARDDTAGLRPYLSGRHKHHGFAKLAYSNTKHGIETNLRGSFYSSWLSSATVTSPGFELWDIYAAKRLPGGFELYGTIDNLFNSRDPNAGTAAQARFEIGRTFRVGVRWEFDRGR